MSARPPNAEPELQRQTDGSLALIDANGKRHAPVMVVRAFPISAALESIAITDADGHELAWIESLDQVSAPRREWIETELARREFMPKIERIDDVSSFATPCAWTVRTDRGPTQFVLRGEEAIRRLPANRLMITDGNGIHYLIADLGRLDEHSRKILDRFL